MKAHLELDQKQGEDHNTGYLNSDVRVAKPARNAMSNPSQVPPSTPRQKGTSASLGAFALSILVHLFVVMLVGGYVIYEGVIPRTPFLAYEPEVGLSGDEPVLPPTEDIQEPSVPSDPGLESIVPASSTSQAPAASSDILVSSVSNPALSLPPASGAISAIPQLGLNQSAPSQEGKVDAAPGGNQVIRNLFGGSDANPAAWVGALYDLKQKKGGGSADQAVFLRAWAEEGFKQSSLRDFYSARTRLNATQIFMPAIKAELAPLSFQAEKEVKPSNWLIVYEGRFASPEAGRFRFVGQADDVIIVRVNGKVVFDGSILTAREGVAPLAGWKPKPEQIRNEQRILSWFPLVYGDWMALEPGVNNRIEIILGEIPGGEFFAYLFIQKEGKKYDLDPKRGNAPILPIFRTMEVRDDWSEYPPETIPRYEKRGPVFTPK